MKKLIGRKLVTNVQRLKILSLVNHMCVCTWSLKYESGNFVFYTSQEDLYYPHPLIQDLIWDSLYIFTEPLLTRWPFNKLVREKALQVTMKHIHYEDETSRYITIGCVEKVSILEKCILNFYPYKYNVFFSH